MLSIPARALMALLLLAVPTFASPTASQTHFSSGERRVPLIELYTSEGCSSCPPADRWLSRLKADPGLWKDFTPVAFHVDYWDYIGWKDRFARPEYSDRQRRYAAEGGARFVYTPGLFRNGQEWHGWRADDSTAGRTSIVGDLSVLVDDTQIAVHFDAIRDDQRALNVHVALLGMNLETSVRAGENNGKVLRHDFVALGLTTVPLERSAGGYKAVTRLPEISQHGADLALIAWVSGSDNQTPIQSVGGYLSRR